MLGGDYFQNRLIHVGKRFKELNSVQVEITRPGSGKIVVWATPDRTRRNGIGPEGAIVFEDGPFDYIINAADYVFNNCRTEPLPSDIFRELKTGMLSQPHIPPDANVYFRYTTHRRDRIMIFMSELSDDWNQC